MYLAEILAHGPLLDSQALALARWADEAIQTLSASDPGVQPIADAPKKKKSSKPREKPGDDTTETVPEHIV